MKISFSNLVIKIIPMLLSTLALAQGSVGSKKDLSVYCPAGEFQYKATCYAYAVAYTAMTTEFNIQNNVTDPRIVNTTYFSPGVVMSYHNSSLPVLRRSPRCGKHGTAGKSLEILKSLGTTFNTDFDCDCKSFAKVKEELRSTDRLYKIGDYETLEVRNEYSSSNVDWIRSAINLNHPVIVAVYQNKRLRGIETSDISDLLPDAETMATISESRTEGVSNHVICILGYDDSYANGKGYFLVKNNFEGWGNGIGFSWIPYTYLLPLIQEAYFIKNIL